MNPDKPRLLRDESGCFEMAAEYLRPPLERTHDLTAHARELDRKTPVRSDQT